MGQKSLQEANGYLMCTVHKRCCLHDLLQPGIDEGPRQTPYRGLSQNKGFWKRLNSEGEVQK